MTRPKITLYVDTVSPFAYMAYYILRHEEVFKGCDIIYVPIFLGGLFQKCGNMAPLKIKNKAEWINTERLRWARHFSVPITTGLPPDFPAPSLPIMRALCVIAASDDGPQQPRLTKALDTLYSQHWEHAVATHKPEVLKETLVGLFGKEEAEKILTESTTAQGKQALMANTDRAFEAGAFGIPWFECTDGEGKTEGFFGVSSLGQVVEFLGLQIKGGLGKSGWRALL
ncbi:HCCA isomerase/glutathione S-transferase kappa [Parathielavia appendiculata]|uniref:Glutathione S-transferase kappa n=1 Tax=Parathielavia appendiculata TaxID=2587402 RepID=A0AAN6TSQ8_9PEZI|nr:HCCA isomerase/glutathione S-transferase kappa [Parathielavia appendiculata]